MDETHTSTSPKQWPQLTSITPVENGVQLTMAIDPNLIWFAGHFPEQPVLPGVVQVFWAQVYANKHCPEFTEQLAIKNLKFNQMILPETTVTLTLAYNAVKNQLRFTYHQDQSTYSSGLFIGKLP